MCEFSRGQVPFSFFILADHVLQSKETLIVFPNKFLGYIGARSQNHAILPAGPDHREVYRSIRTYTFPIDKRQNI